MDVKQAVSAAKKYVGELFDDEGITNLGLEEVEFDERAREWHVTIGFSRPWELAGAFLGSIQAPSQQRSYKTVRISDETGIVPSVTGRDFKS